MSLSALIDKLEQAHEGSRELDEAIQAVVIPNALGGAITFNAQTPPPYTTSIDAAMTLAPREGWANMGHRRPNDRIVCWAGFEFTRKPYAVGAFGQTFPLALAAAALKARRP